MTARTGERSHDLVAGGFLRASEELLVIKIQKQCGPAAGRGQSWALSTGLPLPSDDDGAWGGG